MGTAPRSGTRQQGRRVPPGPLDIYLNDHLAGATGGVGLARRVAVSHRDSPLGEPLNRLASEIAEDRQALLEIMGALGVRPRRHKAWAGWAAEKAGRLKSNGRLLRRSPLSTLLELEAMRVAVQAKHAGWTALRAAAGRDPRLAAERLDALVARARRQAETLEKLHLEAAAPLLVPSS